MPTRTARLAVTLALVAATLASLRPLFHAGMWVSDEELHWLRRLSEFDFTLRAGQWWPRWFVNLEWGHGYPFPNFYAPAGLWLAWLPHLLAGSLLGGVKGAYLMAGFLAPWGIYRLLRPEVSRGAALTGALLYLLAPYHTLNIFVRGNLAEYLAMGLFPWALWGLRRLGRRGTGADLCLAGLLIAAFQLSHMLSAFFGTGVMVLVVLLERVLGRISRRQLRGRAVAIGAGTLLSAVFWLPALWDTQHVRVAMLAEQVVAAEHVVYPWQLLDPRWGWGYSLPGPSDQISLQLGLPQVGVLILALLALMRGRGDRRQLILWSLIFAVVTVAMMPWAAPLWRLPLLRMIQFPWRLLAWSSLALAALGGIAVEGWRLDRSARGLVPVLLLALLPLWYCRAEFYREVDEQLFHPEVTRAYFRGNTGEDDYLPRRVIEKPSQPSRQQLEALDSPMSIASLGGGPFDRAWEVDAPSRGLIRLDLYRYPNWRVSVDDQPVTELQPARDGTLVFSCPPGRHTVRIWWADTPIHAVAKSVSALTALILLLGALISVRRAPCRQVKKLDKKTGPTSRNI